MIGSEFKGDSHFERRVRVNLIVVPSFKIRIVCYQKLNYSSKSMRFLESSMRENLKMNTFRKYFYKLQLTTLAQFVSTTLQSLFITLIFRLPSSLHCSFFGSFTGDFGRSGEEGTNREKSKHKHNADDPFIPPPSLTYDLIWWIQWRQNCHQMTIDKTSEFNRMNCTVQDKFQFSMSYLWINLILFITSNIIQNSKILQVLSRKRTIENWEENPFLYTSRISMVTCCNMWAQVHQKFVFILKFNLIWYFPIFRSFIHLQFSHVWAPIAWNMVSVRTVILFHFPRDLNVSAYFYFRLILTDYHSCPSGRILFHLSTGNLPYFFIHLIKPLNW